MGRTDVFGNKGIIFFVIHSSFPVSFLITKEESRTKHNLQINIAIATAITTKTKQTRSLGRVDKTIRSAREMWGRDVVSLIQQKCIICCDEESGHQQRKRKGGEKDEKPWVRSSFSAGPH